MDDTVYFKKQDEDLREYEALCKRCGRCCGSDTGEPCVNLDKDPSGRYYCKKYDNRLGEQRTISGRAFTCVMIRDVIEKGLPDNECGYLERGGGSCPK